MSWTFGSPTTKRCTLPTATATLTPSVTTRPPGTVMVPTRSMTSCMARPQAAARLPSSESSHAVTASPLK